MSQSASYEDLLYLALYFKDISRYANLTFEKEARLAQRIRKGNRSAFNILVQANLRFVVSVARQYRFQGLPLADLISAGNLGLIEAARRFDERKKFKFISYAVWWIRQSILKALAGQTRFCTLPASSISKIYKIRKAWTDCAQKLGQEPTTMDLAEYCGLDESEVADIMALDNDTLSIDPPSDAGSIPIIEAALFRGVPLDDEAFDTMFLDETIAMLLDMFTEKEREIIEQYYGIGTENPMTLEEIGDIHNLTRERIRQIKENAIRKVRDRLRKEHILI